MFTFGTDLVLQSNINNHFRDLPLKDDRSWWTTVAGPWGNHAGALELLAAIDEVDAQEVSR